MMRLSSSYFLRSGSFHWGQSCECVALSVHKVGLGKDVSRTFLTALLVRKWVIERADGRGGNATGGQMERHWRSWEYRNQKDGGPCNVHDCKAKWLKDQILLKKESTEAKGCKRVQVVRA